MESFKCLIVNRKLLVYTIILALGAILFFIKRFQNKATRQPGISNTNDVNRNHGFDRRISYLEYTQHAKCRMDCRQISQSEVEEIMRDGKINYSKSNVNASPCPAYAVEGVTHDDQRVRIVYGQCDQKTKVITVIDLDKEWSCHCPGDDDKYKNRN
jgi:hypothetical protein